MHPQRKRVFVTGGTGLLGNTIIRQLVQDGHHVSALVRDRVDPRVFAGVECDPVRGDVNDQAAIETAIAACDAVIHSAGLIHLGWGRMEESMRVNRDGTAIIARACRDHHKKLVFIGTVNSLAIGRQDRPADETTPRDSWGGQVPCAYVLSKIAAADAVRDAVGRGLRACLVHPGFMLGPWDWKPSSGRMLLELGRGYKPVAPGGGCSVCDSRDVAAAAIAAIDRGGDDGRDYICGGENWTYTRLWTEMARRMSRPRPVWKVGRPMAWAAGWVGDTWTRISGREGDINSAAVRMSGMFHFYDSSRAESELGYTRRPVSQTLDDAAAWLKLHHAPGRQKGP